MLIQNSDLSEYSLVNVRGMDAAELVEALSAMNDNDRLSAAAYLESRGAYLLPEVLLWRVMGARLVLR